MNDINVTTIEAKGLIEWLHKKGATQSQLDSKVVEMIVQGMTDEEITTSDTAKEAINELKSKVNQAEKKIDNFARGIGRIEDRYIKVQELLDTYEAGTKEKVITDESIINSINAFGRMLEMVKEVFGEEHMTDAVICAAITEAGYGVWRSIMGPKTEGEAKRRFERASL